MKNLKIIFLALVFLSQAYAQELNDKHLSRIYTVSELIIKQYDVLSVRDTISGAYESVATSSDIKLLDKQIKTLQKSLEKYHKENQKLKAKGDSSYISRFDTYYLIEDHLGHILDHQVKVHEYFDEYKEGDDKEYSYRGLIWKYSEIHIRVKNILKAIDSQKE